MQTFRDVIVLNQNALKRHRDIGTYLGVVLSTSNLESPTPTKISLKPPLGLHNGVRVHHLGGSQRKAINLSTMLRHDEAEERRRHCCSYK